VVRWIDRRVSDFGKILSSDAPMTSTSAAEGGNKRQRWAGWLQNIDSTLRPTGAVAVWITLPHCKPASKQSDRKLVRDRCILFVRWMQGAQDHRP